MKQNIFGPASPFLKEDPRKNRWAVPYNHQCLNARVDILLASQADSLRGKRVLDLGSHSGIFSYAALKLGAKEVVGVEMEGALIQKNESLFRRHRVNTSKYRFIQADVMEFLKGEKNSFDTILCFGLLYYFADPLRLIELMARASRGVVLLDTFTALYAAVQGKEADLITRNLKQKSFDLPIMVYTLTLPQKPGYTLKRQFLTGEKGLVLQGLPTETLFERFFESLGLVYTRLDWSPHIKRDVKWRDLISSEAKRKSDWADVYSSGIRVSYRLAVQER